MLKISRLTVENMETGCVTDNPQPRVSYCLESDRQNVTLKKAVISIGDWKKETDCQIAVPYEVADYSRLQNMRCGWKQRMTRESVPGPARNLRRDVWIQSGPDGGLRTESIGLRRRRFLRRR